MRPTARRSEIRTRLEDGAGSCRTCVFAFAQMLFAALAQLVFVGVPAAALPVKAIAVMATAVIARPLRHFVDFCEPQPDIGGTPAMQGFCILRRGRPSASVSVDAQRASEDALRGSITAAEGDPAEANPG